MMNSKPSPKNALWKYLFIFPAGFILFIALTPLNAQMIPVPVHGSATGNNAVGGSTNMDIFVVIRPEMTDELLKKIETELSVEGIDVTFSDIQYDRNHMLTAIRVVAKQGGQSIGDVSVTDGSPSLSSEPLVLYLLRSGQNKSGLMRGFPRDIASDEINKVKSSTGMLKLRPGTREFEVHGSTELR